MTDFVWIVIGGFNYEGEVISSLKVFNSELSAKRYKESLEQSEMYDYVILKEVQSE